MHRWVITAVVCGLCGGHALAAEAEERLTGPVPGEVEAFKATLERFESRVEEFHADTAAYAQRVKDAQYERLAGGYGEVLDRLTAQEKSYRTEALVQFESFLRRYPDLTDASDVRLRLAELYFQEAEERWLSETDAYMAALDAAGDDLDALLELEEQGEPRLDLSQVVRLLTRIVDDNRGLPLDEQYPLLDVAYYMLAFCYEQPNSAQHDRDRARGIFEELIAARPDSEYSDAAHVLLGLYYFDEGEFERSIPEFQAVLDRGPDEKHYLAAMYQLAWARYKLNAYDEAMGYFVQLLDASERKLLDEGRPSEFAPEAVSYLALSISDQADERDQAPLDRAQAFFASLGGERRAYEWDVMLELARSLDRYGRPYDAVAVYEFLQTDPEYRLRPENPDFQNEVVRLLSQGYDADLAAAGQARIEMTERYGEGTEWWEANRNDPEAQANARRYIEASLLQVAVEVKVRAQESGDPAAFSLAADKYQEYQDKFPISDDYYANEFQLADALYRAERFDEAAKEYSALLETEAYHDYGDAAVFFLFRVREQLLRERIGAPDTTFAEAETERTYTSEGGVEIDVLQLADEQAALIEAADRVLAREFGAPIEGIDFAAVVDANRAKIEYIPAQVLYYANRYEEARPRLEKIVFDHSLTDEGAYAANLLLSTYITEKDNEQIRKWSRQFATMRLGASEDLIADKSRQFQDTLEKSTYLLGTEAYERGEYLEAAEAYLSFVDEFPDSDNVPDALLSAAFNYDRLGRAADANELYERFVREFPDHPEAKPFYFSIASNYEATFQLDKAIDYYAELVERFPDYEDAPNAQYMVAFLHEGLGNYDEAAEAYRTYAEKFPEVSDREKVHYRVGSMLEKVSPRRALTFYTREYLPAYRDESPDRTLEAWSRIADLHAELGDARRAEAALDDLLVAYDRLSEAGATIGPRGRDAAAASAFRAIQASYDEIVSEELSGNEQKDTELLFDVMPVKIKDFSDQIGAYVSKYLSFEYITAALYLSADARRSYSALGLAVEPPSNLSPADQDAFWEILEEQFFPQFYGVEEQAIAGFEKVLRLADEQDRHSVWVERAQASLNDMRPSDYPAVKQPLLGDVEVDPLPELVPLTSLTDGDGTEEED